MGEAEFFEAELWQVQNQIKAYTDAEARREKGELQRLSILGSWVLNMFAKKGSSITPEKLIPGAWEGIRQQPKRLSEEERKKRFARLDKVAKKVFGNG